MTDDTARPTLREALVFLRSLSDDLADGVLAGEQPDDVSDADWAAQLALNVFDALDRPGNRANGSRAALAATEPELDVEPAFRVTDSDADYLRERMRYYHETKGGRVAHNHIECKLIATLDARLSEKGER